MGKTRIFRSRHMVLVAAAVLIVISLYLFGSCSTVDSFRRADAHVSVLQNRQAQPISKHADVSAHITFYHTIMMFTKVDKNKGLQEKFRIAMRSMVKYGRFLDREQLVLHFVTDEDSRQFADKLLTELLLNASFAYKVLFHDVAYLSEKLVPVVESMQKYFSAGSGAYYSDAIFFLSVAMHHIMPDDLKRIVQLDLDLKFRSNIRNLFHEFDKFPLGAVIGITWEMQPVYRHAFGQFRKENPKTAVGDPLPNGKPGFNSGVMLLDLEAMRHSALYNKLLDPQQVSSLAESYRFQGHLGDQDFFTLIGMKHPRLFHVLACGWNRQLCTWWSEHGYKDVFQLYYHCEGPVYIYHGNCNTAIPDH